MALFQRSRKGNLSAQGKTLKDLTRIMDAQLLLSEEKRLVLLDKIKTLTHLEASRYDSLCSVLIENLVDYCQYLPETANNYYSQAGGLVDYALNRTEAALTLFQEFMVLDQPELLSEEQKLWQYALYSAAILQGIGKIYVEYRVNFYDINGQFLKEWNPLLESMAHNTGLYYSYEFHKEPEVEFRRRINLLLARALMPSSGFSWIASNPEVLAVWLALLNEDEGSAGTLGAILIHADAIAIQRYMLDFMVKGGTGFSGGRYRASTFSGGVPETLLEKEQAIGMEFIQWLRKSLHEGLIMINKAPLLMVPGGMLMCAEIFQLFVREHPEYKNWLAIKQGFLALGLHSQGANGEVMQRFEQLKNQQIHTGIIFSKYALALPATVSVHQINTGKVHAMSATELIHKAQFNNLLLQQHKAVVSSSLQKLNATGKWQAMEHAKNTLGPGAMNSG